MQGAEGNERPPRVGRYVLSMTRNVRLRELLVGVEGLAPR
jgi:hypothetical protein